MPIITSKTDQVIANTFNRREFLKLTVTTGFGVIVYSKLGSVSYAVGAAGTYVPPGFSDFLKSFGNFALDLGMSTLGYKMSQWLPRNPVVQSGFNSFLKGVNGYNPWNDFNMIGGYRTTFLPIQNPNNGLFLLPFFNQGNGRLGSGIEWYSGVSLPQVNDIIKDEDNLDREDRAQYLIPRKPKKNSWAEMLTPERYETDAGSTEFKYKGDNKSGEVNFKIWKRETSGTLEKPAKSGKLDVEIES